MTDKTPRYWFPAKSYGFGWGLPITWQGWLVFLGALLLFACGAFLFPPQELLLAYIVYEVAVFALLLFICQRKGEPTRWRWGKKK
ncbi:hypothetical protein [Janthinobacterium sp. PC23-8]|uniref:hypothetical protein n=1 Tax=Janthinobacterium sp. PC23-8 TaxID=2012679 RepID=UPI000B9723FD|nr:hypothetical protein [Janthinobacterium sp. PC23-8]OYO32186.1 hypothetical protein CD932_14420 [Janthinobacterium sp. PC23-8]